MNIVFSVSDWFELVALIDADIRTTHLHGPWKHCSGPEMEVKLGMALELLRVCNSYNVAISTSVTVAMGSK